MFTFFQFEIKNWLRTPMPWIFLCLITLLCMLATVTDQLTIGGSFGNINKNAPYVAQNWYALFSLLCILLVTAFVNTAAIRDFTQNVHQLVFSKPIRKQDYYFGHFFGAFLFALLPFLGVFLGMILGTALNGVFEWLPPERFGPMDFSGHIWGFLVFAIPNTFFVSCLIYAVATKTKSTIYPFVVAIALLVGYVVSRNLMRNMDNEFLSSLLDPFGSSAFRKATKYWTVGEKNSQAFRLADVVLWNRILWMAIGVLCLMIGYWLFDFSEKNKKVKKGEKNEAGKLGSAIQRLSVLPTVMVGKGVRTEVYQFWSQYKTELKGIVKSVPFMLLTFLGLLNCVPNIFSTNEGYGTHELPVTYTIIDMIRGTFYLFGVIMIVFFSGQLIWKERNAKMDGIQDAFPVKNWILYAGKYLSILTVMFVLQVLLIIASVLAQKSMGYTQHNIGMFVRELLIMDMIVFALYIALSMLVHVFSKNMYMGFGIFIALVFVSNFGLSAMDISSNMVYLGGMPSYTLSDFYGYAPFLKGLSWFSLYWMSFAALMAFFTFLFWQRGKETSWSSKWKRSKQELGNYKWYGLASGGLFFMVASYVFYNTKILNTIKSADDTELSLVEYEKLYKKYEDKKQPLIFDVKYDISLFPESRKLDLACTYQVRNPYKEAIDTLYITIPSHEMDIEILSDRISLVSDDVEHQFRIYAISPALAIDDTMRLDFTTKYAPKGFENEVSFSKFVQNGLFFNNTDISPVIGYASEGELSSKNKRKEYDLPAKSRMPKLDRTDSLNRSSTYISTNSRWVNVETTIRTSPDQIAIAPGSLLKEWEEDGRRCFQYKLDHKAWNFYSFMSAEYEVARRKWKDVDLEVYHLKGHEYNVERMLGAMEKSLDYFTQNFGPYYHNQCRIIEFPRFSRFAQAFPGTMPYSEGIGFIQDFQDPNVDIDLMFYVAAHEIGHQWWAHQECGSAMQGSEMTTETFAQYSAIMVMEKEYGRDQMRKFLKVEMDKYLRGRGREAEKEQPLIRCENQQYSHYNKGSVAMYYLKEMIGEKNVNAALQEFLEKFRYKEPPFPTSLDAVDAFYNHTPDSLKYVVKDLFEDITLFENRCESAIYKALEDGKYEVTIEVSSKKFKSDSLGIETIVSVHDYMEIGAFAKPIGDSKYGKTLYRQQVLITKPENSFTFTVDEKPDKAGIDPFNLLIDRNPIARVKNVVEE